MLVAIVAAGVVSSTAVLAAPAAAQPATTALAPQTRHIGETLDYSLRGEMSQSIFGSDAFGRPIRQTSAPTSVHGHENIAIAGMSATLMSLQRSGSVTATVDGARPATRNGAGWTKVDRNGKVLEDKGKLGGLFLLPVAFLGEQAVKQGAPLQVGDRWTASLGTKLFGMQRRPTLHYQVVGQRSVLGVNVFSVVASGSAPMKQQVLTATGIALGYATGLAHLTVRADYDQANRRLVSMDIELTDTLGYTMAKHLRGTVRDHQRYLVALDASSMITSQHGAIGSDPAADPGQFGQPAP